MWYALPHETWFLFDSNPASVTPSGRAQTSGLCTIAIAHPCQNPINWVGRAGFRSIWWYMRDWTLPELIARRPHNTSEHTIVRYVERFGTSPRGAYTVDCIESASQELQLVLQSSIWDLFPEFNVRGYIPSTMLLRLSPSRERDSFVGTLQTHFIANQLLTRLDLAGETDRLYQRLLRMNSYRGAAQQILSIYLLQLFSQPSRWPMQPMKQRTFDNPKTSDWVAVQDVDCVHLEVSDTGARNVRTALSEIARNGEAPKNEISADSLRNVLGGHSSRLSQPTFDAVIYSSAPTNAFIFLPSTAEDMHSDVAQQCEELYENGVRSFTYILVTPPDPTSHYPWTPRETRLSLTPLLNHVDVAMHGPYRLVVNKLKVPETRKSTKVSSAKKRADDGSALTGITHPTS
ncbi:hypothetical protein C8R43DRAFT_400639 [Mycena crocata]|nr:hypothetical protein C8R43DRAFT_400639 [Mycena crocata]